MFFHSTAYQTQRVIKLFAFVLKLEKNLIGIFFIGSIGGGLKLVINGAGFSESTQVTICNNACQLVQTSYSSLSCMVSWT